MPRQQRRHPLSHPATPQSWWRRRWKGVTTLLAGAIAAGVAAVIANSITSGAERTYQVLRPERQTPAPVPLTASVDYGNDCPSYVIAGSPDQVPRPDRNKHWAAQGTRANLSVMTLTLQGRSDAAVVLNSLRVNVVERNRPASGSVYSTEECGGGIEPRYFEIDLDSPSPQAMARPGRDFEDDGNQRIIPAAKLPYYVTKAEVEVFQINTHTTTCECRYYLELDWSSQGRTGTLRVDDQGKPFHITYAPDSMVRYFFADGWRLS
jgi:hypothetical protein